MRLLPLGGLPPVPVPIRCTLAARFSSGVVVRVRRTGAGVGSSITLDVSTASIPNGSMYTPLATVALGIVELWAVTVVSSDQDVA